MHLMCVVSCSIFTICCAFAADPSFCSAHGPLTKCLKTDSAGTRFCQTYLHLPTSTVTTTSKSTPVTTATATTYRATVFSPSYITAHAPIGTRTITASGAGTRTSTCSRTTLKPYTTTYTLQNGGPTIVYTFTGPNAKRELAAASTTPSCATDRPAATISAACSCLSLEGPTKTVTKVKTVATHTTYRTVDGGTYTYFYATTTTKYRKTITSTSTSYSATSTVYDLHPNASYAVNKTNYDIYNSYRFNLVSCVYPKFPTSSTDIRSIKDYTGVTFYSCKYGLCDLQPRPCKIKDCPNGLTDCLQVCPYVDGCDAILYERNDINDAPTCAFIDTKTNPLSCGYKDDRDDFGLQKRFAFD